MESLLEELKRYVRFDAEDEAALRSLHPIVRPEFAHIAEVFYDRILRHEDARSTIERNHASIERLKLTLVIWMDQLFRGPWDEEYFDQRCAIGHRHARIALPQHYMFGAINVLRTELGRVLDRHRASDPDERRAGHRALGRILELDLAIILHSYREDLIGQQNKKERLSTFGQLISSIGHELRSPLSVMSSSLHLIKNRAQHDERMLKQIGRIEEQLSISNSIINGLLDIIREQPRLNESVSLRKIVDAALATLSVPSDVTLTTIGVDNVPELHAAPALLCQALHNILDNALHAVGSTGQVSLRACQQNDQVEIAISDTGPGVDAAMRKRLFEPLVTTKPGCIGLGLAMAKRIIEQHRGTIAYAPLPGKRGARFLIHLPLEAET